MIPLKIYSQVREYVKRIAIVFHNRHPEGDDVDEYIAEANYLMLLAWDSWDPQKREFRSWMSYVIWRGLLMHHRKLTQKKIVIAKLEAERLRVLHDYSFDVEDMVSDLSAPATIAVRKVLSSNWMRRGLAIIRHSKSQRLRGMLRKDLMKKGWPNEKISRCFREIRRKLRGRE